MDRRHVQVLYTDYARDKAKRHSRMSKGFDTKTVPCPSCAVPGIKAHTYTGTKVYMLNRRELYKDELGEGGGRESLTNARNSHWNVVPGVKWRDIASIRFITRYAKAAIF